ncbi:VOC family protein [uncultured Albimonas sp.]|uniref:VOC family protein n=1 Tax=uncultured Albimonas sp. TaxID=1331701 RepID=UPI0030EC4E71|tara:strand:+ start:4333 stop:4725 length:393 start_codon:yes stop_codon:yes gene_type:complete
MPVLACADPQAVAAFLTAGLGFTLAGWWRDEAGAPSFGVARLGDATLALRRAEGPPAAPNGAEGPTAWAACIYVEDARDFATLAAANGVTIRRGPEDTPYACREVEVASPEGHVLCFAQDLDPGPRGPGL